MKMSKTFLSKENLIYLSGTLFFVVYMVLLYFKPAISMCDETYWTDLARQIAFNGKYYTTVWGGGQPSYAPLYSYLLAGWFKIFGFSYYSAHAFPTTIAYISYLCMSICLCKYQLVKSRYGILLLSFLFWMSPQIYDTINLGRVEPLCMLFSILTIVSFIVGYEKGCFSISVFVWSWLVIATGFQGAIFATVVIAIYLVIKPKDIKNKVGLIVSHITGYIVSLLCISVFMWIHNCFKAFLRTTFGFSNLVNLLGGFENLIFNGTFTHDDITFNTINTSKSISDVMIGLTLEGLVSNFEYLCLLVLLLILSICLKRKGICFSHVEKALVYSSFLIPIVFVLLGRYAHYYAWTPYLPCITATVILVDKTAIYRTVSCLLSVGITVWFLTCPLYKEGSMNFDFSKQTDNQIKHEITLAKIDSNQSTYIPYSWYYYIVEENENLYFPGSGRLPKETLRKMILCPPYSELKNLKDWFDYAKLKPVYLYNIGDKRVYKLISVAKTE